MRSSITVSENDEGKRVVNARRDDVGRVAEVRNGAVYVDPDPGLAETIMSKLGWNDADDEDTYRLDTNQIDEITDDEIRLKR